MSYVLAMDAPLMPWRGFGDAASVSKGVAVGGSFAASGATAVLGSIAASGGTVLGLAASSLVPVVGPIIAAATMGIQALVANSGCGPTCVVTSQWANQAEPVLQQNLDAYFSQAAPRTDAQKAVAIANFKTVWAKLQELCGQPGTGDAGVRCITDRQSGACKWKQTKEPQYPGIPNVGECWNWFSGYLKPIQDDPTVSDASAAGSEVASLVSGVSSSSLLPLLLIGGLVVLAVSL